VLLLLGALLALAVAGLALPVRAQDQGGAVVYAVLFYSPSCPHCHEFIENDWPTLHATYGDTFQLIFVNTTTPGGQGLFQAAVTEFAIPPERQGVPMMICQRTVMVGRYEMLEQLPLLIESGLESGGIGLPAIPGLEEAFAEAQAQATQIAAATAAAGGTVGEVAEASNGSEEAEAVQPATQQAQPAQSETGAGLGAGETASPPMSLAGRIAQDQPGNSIAIVLLVGMVVSIGAVLGVGVQQLSAPSHKHKAAQRVDGPGWLLPVVALIGLSVAIYLAYVELTQTVAFCGPVGDCNPVHESAYARLFGVLPIGVLGVIGYVLILIVWAVGRWWSGSLAEIAPVGLLGLALFGVLFSIYLTFLEPFVIGYTCSWCLISAIAMTVILWLVSRPGWVQLHMWFRKS
jgi:uncharacterized membrane protein